MDFDQIATTLLVPGAYTEVDPSRNTEGLAGLEHTALIIGQRTSSGSVAELVVKRIHTDSQGDDYFGVNSQLADMLRTYRENNPYTKTYAIALDDDGAGVAASGGIAFTASPTKAGTFYFRVNGDKIAIACTQSMVLASMATVLASAVNAEPTCMVTATASGATVDFAADNKGECGNDIDLRVNYYDDEKSPTGLTYTITAMSGGSGNPDLADVWAALPPGEWYQHIIQPFTDSDNLTSIEDEVDDRWSYLKMLECHAYTASKGTLSASDTLVSARNAAGNTILPAYDSPTPPWRWAAAMGALAAYYFNRDPGRPLQTLHMQGILPPPEANRWDITDRQSLLYAGGATYMIDSGGRVLLERLVTTRTTNAYGARDEAFQDVNVRMLLLYLNYMARWKLTTTYPRHKLADDGTLVKTGSTTVTPKIIRGTMLALSRDLEEKGMVEDVDAWGDGIAVERVIDNPNAVAIYWPADLINQLRNFFVKTSFVR